MCLMFVGSRFLNVAIYSFSLSFLTVNKDSLCFSVFTDVSLGSENFFKKIFYRLIMEGSIRNLCGRLIDEDINR